MEKRKILVFLIIILTLIPLYAEGENLNLKIVVLGPGDPLYLWWGHIGLIIEDSVTGRSNFYDYGIFSFDNENFFLNFAFGRLLYSCGVSPAALNMEYNVSINRDIIIYTLDVPPEKRAEVKRFAETNVLPENRDYFYHHFDDNCSTRIRDIVDLMTDGQFSAQYKNTPGRFTLREHVRRHTWFSPAADWALNFWMGQGIDSEISVWEEMFLPSEVGKRIEEFYYTDSRGITRKLVTSVDYYYRAHGRPAVLDVPRRQWPRQLVFSTALAFLFCIFAFLHHKGKRIGTVLYGASISLCSFVFGIMALLLYFMNIFTDHDYTYSNLNMIFCTPLLLAGFPFGLCFAFGKNEEKRIKYDLLLRLLWLLSVIGILLVFVLKTLPAFRQQNLTDIMLLLPVALVFAFQPAGLREIYNRYLKRSFFKGKISKGKNE